MWNTWIPSSISGPVQRALANTTWLLLQHAATLLVAMMVAIWIARYLGPIQLGRLMFAASLVALFTPLLTLGLETIIIRELVRRPDEADAIIGSALPLRLASGLVALLLIVVVSASFRPDREMQALIAITGLSLLPQVLHTFSFWFASRTETRYTVMAHATALVAAAVLRAALIWFGAPLVAFAWAVVGEIACSAVLVTFFYRRRHGPLFQCRFSSRIALRLFRDSWPLMLREGAILIYMRIDQVMLRQMVDETAVGIYQPAVFFLHGLSVLPMAVVASTLPAVVELKETGNPLYRRRLRQIYDLLTWTAVGSSVLVCILARPLVNLLFGADFELSAPVLALLVWGSVFIAQGVARSQADTAENLQFSMQFVTFGACLLNILLNLWLIPHYGPIGAAGATLATQCFAAILGPMFLGKTRATSLELLGSYLAPVRLVSNILRRVHDSHSRRNDDDDSS